MINTLVQFCSETLPTQPSVRYARFQHWICSSGSTGEHSLSKKAARWNFQFDIGKQRRDTLFRFMNTLDNSVVNTLVRFRVDFVSWICSCLTVFLNIRIREEFCKGYAPQLNFHFDKVREETHWFDMF